MGRRRSICPSCYGR
jgi:hypothetical protein